MKAYAIQSKKGYWNSEDEKYGPKLSKAQLFRKKKAKRLIQEGIDSGINHKEWLVAVKIKLVKRY